MKYDAASDRTGRAPAGESAGRGFPGRPSAPPSVTRRAAREEGSRYAIVYQNMAGAVNRNPGTYTYGVGLMLSAPEKTGHAFGGWYLNSECAEGSRVVAISDTSIGSVTLYAKWTPIRG